MIFMICIPHQILSRWSNQELDGQGMGHEVCVQGLVGIVGNHVEDLGMD